MTKWKNFYSVQSASNVPESNRCPLAVAVIWSARIANLGLLSVLSAEGPLCIVPTLWQEKFVSFFNILTNTAMMGVLRRWSYQTLKNMNADVRSVLCSVLSGEIKSMSVFHNIIMKSFWDLDITDLNRIFYFYSLLAVKVFETFCYWSWWVWMWMLLLDDTNNPHWSHLETILLELFKWLGWLIVWELFVISAVYPE